MAVGALKSVVMSHDNSGPSPSWHLTAVSVRRACTDRSSARVWDFFYDGWISRDKGAGALEVEIQLSSRNVGHKASPAVEVYQSGSHNQNRPREGIDAEALSTVCKDTRKSVLELHMPDLVASAEFWGLTSLARKLTTKPVRPPSSCRNAVVMLVGSHAQCARFIQWFSGTNMTHASHDTRLNMTVVRAAKTARVSRGNDPTSTPTMEMQHMLQVPGMTQRLYLEEIAGVEKRCTQISFILAPSIEGSAPDSNKTSVAQVLDTLHGELPAAANLEKVFQEVDASESGHISADELEKAMVKLGLDTADGRALNFFKALDVSGDGAIDHAPLSAALKHHGTTYEYNLENALDAAAERYCAVAYMRAQFACTCDMRTCMYLHVTCICLHTCNYGALHSHKHTSTE